MDMKKITFIVVLLFFTVELVSAQRGNGNHHRISPEQMAQKQTQKMKESLSLTDEQVPKVKALNFKYINLMMDARKLGLERQDMMFKMKELSDDKKREMKKVLNKEQFKKYKKYVNARMENRQTRASGGMNR